MLAAIITAARLIRHTARVAGHGSRASRIEIGPRQTISVIRIVLGVVLPLSVVSSAPAQMNLVNNGSFEQPGFGGDNFRYLTGGNASLLTGWTCANDGVQEASYVYFRTRYETTDSDYTVYLNDGDSLTTMVTVIQGHVYQVSFDSVSSLLVDTVVLECAGTTTALSGLTGIATGAFGSRDSAVYRHSATFTAQVTGTVNLTISNPQDQPGCFACGGNSIDNVRMVPDSCPGFGVQPISTVACTFEAIDFTVVAAGSEPLSYQWRKNRVPIETSGNPSAASPTLTLTNVSGVNAGLYDCIVVNACGNAISNAADLDVYCSCPPYANLGGVIDAFAPPADNATPSPSLRDAVSTPERSTLEFDQIPGTTPGVDANRAVAHTFTNIPGDLISAALTFRVRSGPNVNPDGEGTDRMRLGFATGSGGDAAFDVGWDRFFGVGNTTDAYFPGVTWGGSIDRTITLDLTALPRATQQPGFPEPINLLPDIIARGFLDFVVSDDSGVDYVELNGMSTDGQTMTWIGSRPASIVLGACDGDATFSITSGGSDRAHQWRRDGTPLADMPGHITGAGTNTLTIIGTDAADVGSYDCVVTNSCGSTTSEPATLTICPADFTCDGVLNSSDFFDFLTAFFSNAPAADFNADGTINSQDFFDFVSRFMSPC